MIRQIIKNNDDFLFQLIFVFSSNKLFYSNVLIYCRFFGENDLCCFYQSLLYK